MQLSYIMSVYVIIFQLVQLQSVDSGPLTSLAVCTGLVQNLDSGLWTGPWTGLWTAFWTGFWTGYLDLTSYAWPRRHVRGRYISVSVDAYGNDVE